MVLCHACIILGVSLSWSWHRPWAGGERGPDRPIIGSYYSKGMLSDPLTVWYIYRNTHSCIHIQYRCHFVCFCPLGSAIFRKRNTTIKKSKTWTYSAILWNKSDRNKSLHLHGIHARGKITSLYVLLCLLALVTALL